MIWLFFYPLLILSYSDDAQVGEYIYGVSGKRAHGAGLTNLQDDFWALATSENDAEVEEYFHIESLSDGGCVIYRIRIVCDNWENYKVVNIINKFLGSFTPTSY